MKSSVKAVTRVQAVVAAVIVIVAAVVGVYAYATLVTPSPGTVKVLHVAGPEMDEILKHTSDFEKQTGIKLITEEAPRDLRTEKAMRELSSQTGEYDVLYCWIGELPSFAATGGLLPLDDYLTAQEKQDVYGDLLKYFSWKGKVVMMPQYVNFNMLFYRKDLVEDPTERAAFRAKYGYDLKAPETWKELYDIAEFFYRPPDFYGYTVQGIEWLAGWNLLMYMWTNGGGWVDAEQNLIIDSPKNLEALEFMKSLVPLSPPGWETVGLFEADDLMKAGKLFCYQTWTYIWGAYHDEASAGKVYNKVGVALPPHGPNGQSLTVGSGGGYMVSKGSKNPASAVKYLKWVASFDIQKAHAFALPGNFPTRAAVWQDPSVKAAVPDVAVLEAGYRAYQGAYPPWWNEGSSKSHIAWHSIAEGKMTPKEGLDFLTTEFRKLAAG